MWTLSSRQCLDGCPVESTGLHLVDSTSKGLNLVRAFWFASSRSAADLWAWLTNHLVTRRRTLPKAGRATNLVTYFYPISYCCSCSASHLGTLSSARSILFSMHSVSSSYMRSALFDSYTAVSHSASAWEGACQSCASIERQSLWSNRRRSIYHSTVKCKADDCIERNKCEPYLWRSGIEREFPEKSIETPLYQGSTLVGASSCCKTSRKGLLKFGRKRPPYGCRGDP